MNNLISKLIIILILILCILYFVNDIETYTNKCEFQDVLLLGIDTCKTNCDSFYDLGNESVFSNCDKNTCNKYCDNQYVISGTKPSGNVTENRTPEQISLTVKTDTISWVADNPNLIKEYKIHITQIYNNYTHLFIPNRKFNTISVSSLKNKIPYKDNEDYKITIYGFINGGKLIRSNTETYPPSYTSNTTSSQNP